MTKTTMMLPAALAAAISPTATLTQAQARDGTPANPPSDAVGRTIDRATGQPTVPDGRPGNPPSTAVGRAADGRPRPRALFYLVALCGTNRGHLSDRLKA